MKKNKFNNKISNFYKKKINDFYYKQSKIKKLRSRAWFKLDQINKKEKLFYSGMNVIDLGSHPGSWSQYVINKIKKNGNLLSCDLLPMKNISYSRFKFIKGNIIDKLIINKILKYFNNKVVNIIISDMSPNISGISYVDNYNTIKLFNAAFNICKKLLSFNGYFLIKIFNNNDFSKYIKKIKNFFLKIKICKPKSSKSRSNEIYILAKKYLIKNIIKD